MDGVQRTQRAVVVGGRGGADEGVDFERVSRASTAGTDDSPAGATALIARGSSTSASAEEILGVSRRASSQSANADDSGSARICFTSADVSR